MTSTPVVYVVDDDGGVRRAIARLVDALGYTALVYESAAAFLREHDPHAHGCVVADILMPGMNGLELLEALRTQGSARPFIFLTGEKDLPGPHAVIDAVATLYKPVRAQDLRQALATAVKLDEGARSAGMHVPAAQPEAAETVTSRDDAYEIRIHDHLRYIHAVGTGRRTADSVMRFLREVHAACQARACGNALVEMRFTGPSLDLGSIFRVITDRAADGAALRRVAYVDLNHSQPRRSRFAQDVARNRGVNVRVFESVDAAAAWLRSD